MSSPNFNLAYYLSQPTSEYQVSPNFLAWLTANLQVFQDVYTCAANLLAAFDLGQAVGAQLDTLGQVIELSRTVTFEPTGGVSPVLDDETYRLLLRAAVFKNHWNGKTSSLRTMWNALFPGGVMLITDHQDMSVDFYIAGAFSSIIQDLIVNGYIIPRPQGVLYTIVFATLPLLGFDFDNSFISGFDSGHFA